MSKQPHTQRANIHNPQTNILKMNIENETIQYIKNLENKIQKQAERLSANEDYKCFLESIVLSLEPNAKLPLKQNDFYVVIGKAKDAREALEKYNLIREDLEKILQQKKKITIESQNKIDELSNLNNRLTEENKILKEESKLINNQLNEHKRHIQIKSISTDNTMNELTEKINFLESENFNLKSKSNTYYEQLLIIEKDYKNISDKYSNLTTDFNLLEGKYNNLIKEKSLSYKETSHIIEELSYKEKKTENLSEEIKQLKAKNDSLSEENILLKEKNQCLNSKKNELDSENLKLINIINELKSTKFTFDENNICSDSDEIICQLKKSLSYFKTQLNEVEEERNFIQSQLKDKDTAIDSIKFENTVLKKDFDKLDTLFKQREIMRNKILNELNEEKQNLQKANKEKSLVEEENYILKEKIKFSETTGDRFKQDSNKQMSSLHDQVRQLIDEVNEKKNLITDFENKIKNHNLLIKRLEDEKSNLLEINKNVNDKYNSLHIDYKATYDELSKYKNIEESSKKSLNDFIKTNESLTKELLELTSKIDKIEYEYNEFKVQIHKDLLQFKDLYDDLLNQFNLSCPSSEYKSFTDIFDEFKLKLRTVHEFILKIRNNNKELSNQNDKNHEYNLNLENENKEMKSHIDYIQNNLNITANELKSIIEKHKSQCIQTEIIEKENFYLKEKISKLNSSNNLKDSKIESLNQIINDKEEAKIDLETRNKYLEELNIIIVNNKKFLEKHSYSIIKQYMPGLNKIFSELLQIKEGIFKYENEQASLKSKLYKLDFSSNKDESEKNNELENTLVKERENLKLLINEYDKKILIKRNSIIEKETQLNQLLNNKSSEMNKNSSYSNITNIKINQSDNSNINENKKNIDEIMAKLDKSPVKRDTVSNMIKKLNN